MAVRWETVGVYEKDTKWDNTAASGSLYERPRTLVESYHHHHHHCPSTVLRHCVLAQNVTQLSIVVAYVYKAG